MIEPYRKLVIQAGAFGESHDRKKAILAAAGIRLQSYLQHDQRRLPSACRCPHDCGGRSLALIRVTNSLDPSRRPSPTAHPTIRVFPHLPRSRGQTRRAESAIARILELIAGEKVLFEDKERLDRLDLRHTCF